MNPTQLALTLAITGVASAVLLNLNKTREKAGSIEGFNQALCGIPGLPASSYCGGQPAEDDVVASDGQDGQEPFDPAPPSGGETPMARLPIYG